MMEDTQMALGPITRIKQEEEEEEERDRKTENAKKTSLDFFSLSFSPQFAAVGCDYPWLGLLLAKP